MKHKSWTWVAVLAWVIVGVIAVVKYGSVSFSVGPVTVVEGLVYSATLDYPDGTRRVIYTDYPLPRIPDGAFIRMDYTCVRGFSPFDYYTLMCKCNAVKFIHGAE